MSDAQAPIVVPLRGPWRWHTAVAYAISAACLIWVLHDIDLSRLARETRDMAWRWVALSAVFNVLSYAAQGWRWQLLLQPVGRLSVLETTRAIYAGLFVNEVLPLRTGEVLRAYLVAQRLDTKVSSVVPSMVVERLFDGVWLAVSVAVTALLVPLPHYLLHAGNVLGVGLLVLTALIVIVIVRASRRPADPAKTLRLALFLEKLARDLKAIGASGVLWKSAFGSLLLLAGQILAFWLVMWAYGIRLSFWAGAAVLIIMHLGTVVPSAPANAGPFQFFTVVGLGLFGVDRRTAAPFSLVVFFLLTFPLLVLGFFAMSQSGITLAGARRQLRAAREARTSPPACVPPGSSPNSL